MIRCQLDANPWSTVDVHHVPVVFRVDGPAEHASPEATLCRQIGSVEHDDLMDDLHATIVAAKSWARTSFSPGAIPRTEVGLDGKDEVWSASRMLNS